MRSRYALLPALALLMATGAASRAQTPPSPEQAKALEDQIAGWLAHAVPSLAPLPPRPVQLTAEGDHYLARVPLNEFGLLNLTPPDAAFTAKARPLEGTRWALDDQQLPADVSFTVNERLPTTASPDQAAPTPGVTTPPEPVTYHFTFGKQDAHSVFDTAYATPTSGSGTLTAVDVTKTGGIAASATHFDRLSNETSSRPTDPAHADLVSDTIGEGYFTKSVLDNGSGVTVSADRSHTSTTITGLAHDKLLPIMATAIDLSRMAKTHTSAAADGPTPEERGKLRELLGETHDLLTGGKFDHVWEGMKFDVSGHSGALRKMEVSFNGDAPGNILAASMGFDMDGLTIDELPPALAVYLPKHFAIHPTLSNLDVAQLTKMGMDAGMKEPPDQHPGMLALFAHGGIVFGFDSLALDLAGAEFSGNGKFTMTAPNTLAGEADITARGLDDLLAHAQADPMLQRAVPVLILLKGIAKTTGDRALWQVTLANGKTLVNGVDLAAMAGGKRKP